MKKILFTALLLVFICVSSAYAQNPIDMNTGTFVQDGDWIYYLNCYDRKVYKVKTDGTEHSLLIDTQYIRGEGITGDAGICFDGKYIYLSASFSGEYF